MKIHCYEKDTRQNDPDFVTNMGPFSMLNYKMNEALKKLDAYALADEADYVMTADGLDVGFQYKNKKSMVWNVWETTNTLPYYLLQAASGRRIFGLSNQITNLWRKYGHNVKTLYPGCDTEFWHQTRPKDAQFTFLHVNSSNTRAGLDLTLQAFGRVFRGQNVKLIVKDTNNSPVLKGKIDELIDLGCNIEHISSRLAYSDIRDLYSRSHVCLNLIRITSFGLPLLECSACNCLCVTGDVPPTNEIIQPEYGVLVKSHREIEFSKIIPTLTDEWGMLNCFPPFECPEQPRMFDFGVETYAQTLSDIYMNWEHYSKMDTRTPIVKNWSWEKAAKTLIEYVSVVP